MRLRIAAALLLVGAALRGASTDRVDASTPSGKVLLGYQGWFDCPDASDGQWRGWSRGTPTPATIRVDMYPDLSEFAASDLCVLPGFTIGGRQAYLYSARNPAVVARSAEPATGRPPA